MATTHARPAPTTPVRPSKIRPIFERGPQTAIRRRVVALTANRLPGVGPSTSLADRTVQIPGLAPLTTLIAGAVATALQSLEALDRQAREAAADFRLTQVDSAKRSLKNLVQSTRTLIRLAAMAAHITGTDIRTLCRTTGFPADEQTQNALDLLTARLLAKDWLALADLLDEEFAGALAEWRSIFEALGESCFDPGPEGLAA
jgi:hypothetical protein